MIFWRTSLFYLFLAIYLVTAPLLILHMLGFVAMPSGFRFVKSGIVSISTIPPHAKVYINGKEAEQRTPVTLRNLVPGEHFIRIEKENFLDWVAHIYVVSNKVLYINNVSLINSANH